MEIRKKAIVACLAVLVIGLLAISGCSTGEESTAPEPEQEAPVAVSQPALPAQPDPVAQPPASVPSEPGAAEQNPEAVPEETVEEEQHEESVVVLFKGFNEDGIRLGESVIVKKKLSKDTVKFDGESYVVRTYFETDEGLRLATNLQSDLDLEGKPAMVYEKGSIRVFLDIEDNLDLSLVGDDDRLELSLLGKRLSIVGAGEDSLDLQSGDRIHVQEGLSFESDGKTITLNAVSSSAAALSCEGDFDTAKEGQTVRLCGQQVRVVSLFSKYDGEGMAELLVGEDVLETVEDGDVFEEDEDGNVLWRWVIDTSSNEIGLEHSVRADEADEEVLLPGESLVLLDVLKVELLEDSSQERMSLEASLDRFDVGDVEDMHVLVLEGRFDLSSGDEVTKLLLGENGSVYYKNDENEWVLTEGVKLAESDVELEDGCLAGVCLVADLDAEDLTLVTVDGEDVSVLDHDVLSLFGAVVEDVKDSVEDDVVEFSVPLEQSEFKVRVSQA